jgi:hypothetical protein
MLARPTAPTTTRPGTARRVAAAALGACLLSGASVVAANPAAALTKPSASTTGVPSGVTLKPSGSITVTKAGTVINGLDVSGNIVVAANDVTIKNTRIRYSGRMFGIQTKSGYARTVIQNVDIVLGVSTTGSAAGIAGGAGTVVRHTDISGTGDGIKAENGGRYEHNYIHVEKPSGSSLHLDGIQGSGKSNWTVYGNTIDVPISKGGNFAVFVQSWNGTIEKPVSSVKVDSNWLSGGNYTVYVEDGKSGSGYVKGVTFTNNRFGGDYRYGIKHLEGGTTWTNNTSWVTGKAC